MATIQEALTQGWQFQRAGQLPTAEQVYRRILEVEPSQVDALYLLGTVCHRQGKLDDAAQFLLEAVSRRPDFAEAHNNLGVVMATMGRRIDAVNHFRHVVRLKPADPDALNNLGNALREQGDWDEAVEWLQQALQLRPEFPDALHNLGLTLHDQGKFEDAVKHLGEAVRLRPEFVDATSDLGLVLAKLKRWEAAAEVFRRLIRLRPDKADGHIHLGAVLRELNKLDESAERLQIAIKLKPDDPGALNSLGLTLQQIGRLDQAEVHLRRAIELMPDHADAQNNLGITLAQLGRFDEAIVHYDRAIELKPDQPIFRRNRSLAWLTLGDFPRGWPDYEYRWQCPGFVERERNYPSAPWRGESLAGKSILLYWEQGLGDTIQLIRFAAAVKRLGAETVLAEVQPALARLLTGVDGVDRVVKAGDSVPAFDYHVALGSLPYHLGTTVDTIPASIPYLHAEPDRIRFWRSQLDEYPGFRIGIAWQGNPKQGGDRLRSIPLTNYAPLARVDGVRLLSLQKEPGAKQLEELGGAFPVVDLAPRLDLSGGAFLDTAAVMKNLDLVITCDTSIGHLAGALGVPIWLALSAAADWRWLKDRVDTPWYPTVKLFRQAQIGNWSDVFERMASELRLHSKRLPSPSSISIDISPGELIDKVTILQIKNERIQDPAKLRNVGIELEALTAACDESLPHSEEVTAWAAELKEVNEVIWDIEDALRQREREQRFDAEFIELARGVYKNNDRRAALKRLINDFYSARFIEEKEHPHY